MNYHQKFDAYRNLVEEWLKERITVPELPEKTLFEAMRYSLTAGGKRLRPVLSLAVCDMLGGDREAVMPFACAVELIHTYSLIHDDLPCMDNDDYRRGKPTNHKVFGEAMALLAGDALLNTACEIMLEAVLADEKDALRKAAAARLIMEAAGASGMIAGQVIDMESEQTAVSYDQLCRMHSLKTGALIRASILSAALICGPDERTTQALERYGKLIGLAFQIKDDLLDVEGDAAVLGKSTGSDVRNHKSTFVTLLGTDKAKELLKSTVEEAVKALEGLQNTDFLIHTAAYIAERKK
ncbi:MAG TPA: polyprenyl synthetase family protein [Thermoclostridium caenicola]|uniref:polyprenyl synthetase family protein n=1 Tax=Thermoclostridium caenicola TaxID=659425 RepID=UPI002C15DBCD|nr:farnesyl diphosphate synthase [Thermoclostridium caenicola]HOL84895.1 polyprenyl synthetase family protein [Thermoclostridium caenicola]HPO77349.1 polyprenyl synthetase family protein [Thermoclostridium caenicola]HPU21736.1 polyprenyl synthetase family protein [Thermoclostridium caenicola]